MLKDDRPGVCLATGNEDKRREIARALFSLRVGKFLVPEGEAPDETGSSYEENARIKAIAYSQRHPDWIVVAEDSGLDIPALPEMVGLDTGPFFREHGLRGGFEKIFNGLAERPPDDDSRRATFTACVAVAVAGRCLDTFKAAVEGTIARTPRGEREFGFDQIFVPDGTCATLSEMRPEDKIDHNARAIAAKAARNLIRSLSATDAVLSSSEAVQEFQLLEFVKMTKVAVAEGLKDDVLVACADYRVRYCPGSTLAVVDVPSWSKVSTALYQVKNYDLEERAQLAEGEHKHGAVEKNAFSVMVLSEGTASSRLVEVRDDSDIYGVPVEVVIPPLPSGRREIRRLKHALRNLFSPNWARHRRKFFFEPLHGHVERLSHKSAHLASLRALVDLADAVLEKPEASAFAVAKGILRLSSDAQKSPWHEIARELPKWLEPKLNAEAVVFRVARDYPRAFAAIDSEGQELMGPRGARTWWGPFSNNSRDKFVDEWKQTAEWHCGRLTRLAVELDASDITRIHLKVVLDRLRIELNCVDIYLRRLREAMVVY